MRSECTARPRQVNRDDQANAAISNPRRSCIGRTRCAFRKAKLDHQKAADERAPREHELVEVTWHAVVP